MKKIIAQLVLIAIVAVMAFPDVASAAHTYSRSQTGVVVIGAVTFTASIDTIGELNCNTGEDDFWYIGAFDANSGIEYYPDVSEITPTSDLSSSFTIDMPMGAAITEIWTACLTSDESFDSENGGLTLETGEIPGVDLVFLVIL